MYEPRTHFLPKLLNNEIEEHLEHNDIIIVPVGTVEMHGGMPLNSETMISEAFALKMAEEVHGLVLNNLPYFYAGATASGRGTVQVSVRQGIDYLSSIAHSLLRQGFKRQIYISFHGPAHMTCSPMVRDFFDETGVPILYMDLSMQLFKNATDLFTSLDDFHAITVASYDLMNCLADVPLTTEHYHQDPQTVSDFDGLFSLAYQSGSTGYFFGDPKDHMSTPEIPTVERRQELADQGRPLIEAIVKRLNLPEIVMKMAQLEEFSNEVKKKYPWAPGSSVTRQS